MRVSRTLPPPPRQRGAPSLRFSFVGGRVRLHVGYMKVFLFVIRKHLKGAVPHSSSSYLLGIDHQIELNINNCLKQSKDV